MRAPPLRCTRNLDYLSSNRWFSLAMTGGDVLPEAARYTYLAKIDGDVNFTVSLPLARALQQQPPIK
eukprot:7348843-Prymnesium_polylepis.1